MILIIGATGWAIGDLWIYEQVAAPLRDWLVPKLPNWRLFNVRYLAQCAYCASAWATVATWAITWIAVGLALPALSLGAALAFTWALVIWEVSKDTENEAMDAERAFHSQLERLQRENAPYEQRNLIARANNEEHIFALNTLWRDEALAYKREQERQTIQDVVDEFQRSRDEQAG